MYLDRTQIIYGVNYCVISAAHAFNHVVIEFAENIQTPTDVQL